MRLTHSTLVMRYFQCFPPDACAAAMSRAAAAFDLSHCVCGASAAMQCIGPHESGGGMNPSVALANTRFCSATTRCSGSANSAGVGVAVFRSLAAA